VKLGESLTVAKERDRASQKKNKTISFLSEEQRQKPKKLRKCKQWNGGKKMILFWGGDVPGEREKNNSFSGKKGYWIKGRAVWKKRPDQRGKGQEKRTLR